MQSTPVYSMITMTRILVVGFLTSWMVGCDVPVPTPAVTDPTGAPNLIPKTPKELLKYQPKKLLDIRVGEAALQDYVQTWCAEIQPLLEEPSIKKAMAAGHYQVVLKVNAFAFHNTDQIPPIFETVKAHVLQCKMGKGMPHDRIQHQWYDATATADRKRPIAYLWLVVNLEKET